MTVLKRGKILTIREPYDTLVSENKTYLSGQHIWAETTFGSGIGLKLGEADPVTGAGGRPFTQLPWIIDPNISYGGNRPFAVRNTDSSYSFNSSTNTITITDSKLVGVNDPVISITQNNVILRDGDYTFDATHGVVSFNVLGGPLNNGEKIILFTGDGYVPGSSSVESRVTLLEKIVQPMTNGLARIFWLGGANNIPTGWVEDTTMRGLFPMGYIPGDVTYGTIGNSGGNKNVTLQIANIPSHAHNQGSESLYADYGTNGETVLVGNRNYPAVNVNEPSYRKQLTSSVGDGQPFSIVNPYMLGIWIKYTG